MPAPTAFSDGYSYAKAAKSIATELSLSVLGESMIDYPSYINYS